MTQAAFDISPYSLPQHTCPTTHIKTQDTHPEFGKRSHFGQLITEYRHHNVE
jgi:hypothetical protein